MISLLLFLAFGLVGQADKASAKEKGPIEIQINAPAKTVRPLIAGMYAHMEWQVDGETDSTLHLSKRGNLQIVLAYGQGSRFRHDITIVESGGVCTVIVDMGATNNPLRGQPQRFNWNADKKWRKAERDILEKIKALAETP